MSFCILETKKKFCIGVFAIVITAAVRSAMWYSRWAHLTFTMSAGVPTKPPVNPVGRIWERLWVVDTVWVFVCVFSHLQKLPAWSSGKRAWGPDFCCPSCPSLSHKWQIWWENKTSEGRGGDERGGRWGQSISVKWSCFSYDKDDWQATR